MLRRIPQTSSRLRPLYYNTSTRNAPFRTYATETPTPEQTIPPTPAAAPAAPAVDLSSTSSTPPVSAAQTSDFPTSIPTESTSSSPSPTQQATPTTRPPRTISLPYLVTRTPSQNLPVYQDAKRGGSLKQTYIRKIDGDVAALKKDLLRELKFDGSRKMGGGIDGKGRRGRDGKQGKVREAVVVNGVTGQVVVQGWRKAEVTAFLAARGF